MTETTTKERYYYRNNQPGIVCVACGKEIALGARKTWERTGKGKPPRNWHVECTPNDGVGVVEARNDEQDQQENAAGAAGDTASAGAADWMNGLAGAILPFLENKLKTKLDASQVEQIVKKMLDGAVLLSVAAIEIQDKRTDEVRDLGVQHRLFPTLLQVVRAGVNTWLTGPAGGGKTTAVQHIAKALGLDFYHVGALDNEYKLMGFVDAQGKVVSTVFRQWWVNGGVLCLDEIDSWLPSATLCLNGALANGHCTFPDGLLPRHESGRVVACANTWGLGGTDDYVGRMKQDAAFVNRFPARLDWSYDEALELAISGNPAWAKRVQHLRKRAKQQALKVVISPRQSIAGAKLLADGMEQELVEQLTIRNGMTDEQWSSIQ